MIMGFSIEEAKMSFMVRQIENWYHLYYKEF
jgi:hypothetical protein